MTDFIVDMEVRVKADQAKAALEAVKTDLTGVGTAAKEASHDGAQLGPALQKSAQGATAALDKMEAELAALRAQLAAVTAAENAANQAMAALAAQVQALEAKLGKSRPGGAGGAGAAGAMGNLVAQFNDVGMMMAAGQNPLQLAIQQGSQITQVIGPMGASGAVKALGGALVQMLSPINLVTYAAIAAGAVFVQWLTSSTEEIRKVKDSLDDLEGAVGRINSAAQKLARPPAEAAKEYGRMADEAERALAAMAKADERAALKALRESIDATTAALLRGVPARAAFLDRPIVGRTMLVEDFDIAEESARELIKALEALSSAKGPEAQAQAALRVMQALDGARDSAGNLPAPLEAAYATMAKLTEEASSLIGASDAVRRAMIDWGVVLSDAQAAMASVVASAPGGGWLNGAIGDAATLGSTLWDAARAAAAARGGIMVRANPSKGPGFENGGRSGSTMAPYIPPALTLEDIIKRDAAKANRGGGGGGGGQIDVNSFAALTAAAEKAMATLDASIAGINEKVRLGLMSTAEGTKAIASAKEQAAGSIAELIPKLEKASDAAGPKAAAAVAKWRTEVRGLVVDLGQAGSELSEKLSNNFEKGFAAFLTGAKSGKAAMADFKNFILQQMAEIAAQRFTSSIISPLIDGLLGGIFPGAAGGGGTGSLGLPMPFAKGGIPSGRGISAYSGTIVDQPTFFPMAKGAYGLMGEAGPEAVVPLARGADGKLGVRSTGGGGAPVTVNVINNAQGTKATARERQEGGMSIVDVMIEQVEAKIAGNIAQGRGPMPDALSGTYGLSRVGS